MAWFCWPGDKCLPSQSHNLCPCLHGPAELSSLAQEPMGLCCCGHSRPLQLPGTWGGSLSFQVVSNKFSGRGAQLVPSLWGSHTPLRIHQNPTLCNKNEMTLAHFPRLDTKSELFRLHGDRRTGCKGLACEFSTAPLTLAYKGEHQHCIPSVTQSIEIHLYYTFSRAVSQNNSLSVFKIYLLANQKNSLQDTWLLLLNLSEDVAVPDHSSQPAQPLVTGNLWICCHCQVRICYSPCWESEPTLPPEGTPPS